jgi:hypothetical protein
LAKFTVTAVPFTFKTSEGDAVWVFTVAVPAMVAAWGGAALTVPEESGVRPRVWEAVLPRTCNVEPALATVSASVMPLLALTEAITVVSAGPAIAGPAPPDARKDAFLLTGLVRGRGTGWRSILPFFSLIGAMARKP